MAKESFGGRIVDVRSWDNESVLELLNSPFSGPVQLRVRFPSDRVGKSEPLVVSGKAGAGDFLFVTYLPDGRVQFGSDHWGFGGSVSEPVQLDFSLEHQLLISAEFLLPRADSVAADMFSPLRGKTLILLDGHVVFESQAKSYPAHPERIFVGENPIGGSTCETKFTGPLMEFAPTDAARIEKMIEPSRWTSERLLTLDNSVFPGPIRLQVQFPSNRTGYGEPLISTGQNGRGDLIFIRYEKKGKLRIGFDHWGAPELMSDLLEAMPGKTHEIVLSMGSLLPPLDGDDEHTYTSLRDRCVVLLDGRVVLDVKSEFFPTTLEQISVGANAIGASTAEKTFSGNVSLANRASVREFLSQVSSR
jgi:hypothetical protein